MLFVCLIVEFTGVAAAASDVAAAEAVAVVSAAIAVTIAEQVVILVGA